MYLYNGWFEFSLVSDIVLGVSLEFELRVYVYFGIMRMVFWFFEEVYTVGENSFRFLEGGFCFSRLGRCRRDVR